MKWILFVLVANHPVHTTYYSSAKACAEAAAEFQKRAWRQGYLSKYVTVWCTPTGEEEPEARRGSWM